MAESTVQHAIVSDMDEPDMKERVEKFNKDMREKIARNTQLVPKTNESMHYLQDEYAHPMVNQDMLWAHGDPTAGFERHEELKEEEDEYDLSNMDKHARVGRCSLPGVDCKFLYSSTYCALFMCL